MPRPKDYYKELKSFGKKTLGFVLAGMALVMPVKSAHAAEPPPPKLHQPAVSKGAQVNPVHGSVAEYIKRANEARVEPDQGRDPDQAVPQVSPGNAKSIERWMKDHKYMGGMVYWKDISKFMKLKP